MKESKLRMLKQIAAGLAAQFGPNCEIVVHDLAASQVEHSIVHIENGHVSGRKVGDGPSKIVMEQLMSGKTDPQDQLAYLTRTPDGKILKSSTIYVHDTNGNVTGILSINFDISALLMVENAIGSITATPRCSREEQELVVYSIVNTLCSLDTVDGVELQVEGEALESYGQLELDGPLSGTE